MCARILVHICCVTALIKFPVFAALLGSLRSRAGIGTQTELAALVGATQQTVSRWEKGESRPREREMPRLASVLGAEAKELLQAAGYGASVELAASVDRPFPVHGLTPDSFERFCLYLLQRLYRGQSGQVHRAGESGHTQGGIDISARGESWVHTFQCKRVIEFGPKKVAAAVAAQTVAADKKFLLLSSVASPSAREEIARHHGWDIWDREDLSSKVRSLPMQDQRELVQVFFRSQRLELLGEPDGSPWLTVSAFFEPFSESKKAFNHNWKLVGRTAEATDLLGALEDESIRVTMLVGAAGGGKSRLLRHVLGEYAPRHPELALWMLSPTDSITAKSIEELGAAKKLLVVDDAHDRDDLAGLMRYCAATANQCRLLLILRPYGREVLKHQAASLALSGDDVKLVELRRPSLDEAIELATEVLEACGGPVAAAKDVAKATAGSPLATVLGAQIVAKEGLHPIWMHKDAEYQAQILSRFQDVIAGGIATGQDVERLRGVLRIVALVQPVLPDEPALLRLIEAMEGVKAHDATRLLKTLIDAGVLFRRGLRYRLAPDLLADSIIERYCLDSTGAVDYVERVFEKAEEEEVFLKNLLLNLGRLDWRQREGDTKDSRLLSGIWSKLRWINEYANPHVEAAAAVAYYQPKLALEFARELIRAGHGGDETVCSIVKYAAYSFEFVDEACMLLWQAGVSVRDSAEQERKDRGIHVLKELASFEPNKPPEFIDKVVTFAIEALDSAEALAGSHAPFEVLEGALATEGHTSWATNSRTITLSAYAVPQAEVRDIRAKIVSAIFRCMVAPSVKRAFQAARALQNALQSPSGLLGLRPGDEERQGWTLTHKATLTDLLLLLNEHVVPAVVLVRIAESVHWHAFYGPLETRDLARRILAHLDRDLDTRLTRGLMDGWGSNTWPIDDETYERSAHEADTAALISDLTEDFSDPKALSTYLGNTLDRLEEAGGADGSHHVLLSRLISTNLGLAQEVVQLQANGAVGTLSSYGGVALGALLNSQTADSRRRVQELVTSASAFAAEMVAEAYARFEPKQSYAPADTTVIRAIFEAKDERVLRFAPSLLRNVAKVDPALAVELVCSVDLHAAGRWSREFFLWLGTKDGIPAAAISDHHLRRLVSSLEPIAKLDDHWVWRFLKLATTRVPNAVVALVKRRLEAAAMSNDSRTTPLANRHGKGEGLTLLKAEGWAAHVVELLEWARSKESEGGFGYTFGTAMAALCGPFDDDALAMLLAWMRGGGSDQHVRVISAVIRDMSNDLIYEHPTFAREALQTAQTIGPEAVDAIRSSLLAVTICGMRSGTPGESFPEDVRQEQHATEMLGKLSRFDSAYELYSALRDSAREGIARQRRQKDAMDAEDEERR